MTLRARIVAEMIEGRIIGYVVTFDDVTIIKCPRKAHVDIARYCP